MSETTAAAAPTAKEAYPDLDAASPTDSVIAGDFGAMSAAEQEQQREEWKQELTKTEEEIMTLRQVSLVTCRGHSLTFDGLHCNNTFRRVLQSTMQNIDTLFILVK